MTKKRKKGEASRRKKKESGTQRKAAATSGIQERQTMAAAAPLEAPKTVRTAKNIEHGEIEIRGTSHDFERGERGEPLGDEDGNLGGAPGHGDAGEERGIVALEDGAGGTRARHQRAEQQQAGHIDHGQNEQRHVEAEQGRLRRGVQPEADGDGDEAGEEQAAAVEDFAHRRGGAKPEAEEQAEVEEQSVVS